MKVTTDSCLFGGWCADEVHQLMVPGLQLLDVGCGSGLLSLMVAQKNAVMIDAVEIDGLAAQQAAENIAASPWKERITVYEEDILQWRSLRTYDVIMSNPPFYEGILKSGNEQKNTAHHSTQLTLAQLLNFIKTHLSANGKFFLLLPYYRLQELQTSLQDYSLVLNQITLVKQSAFNSPFRLMVRGSFRNGNPYFENEISIKDCKGQYTQSFIDLLHHYYLHL